MTANTTTIVTMTPTDMEYSGRSVSGLPPPLDGVVVDGVVVVEVVVVVDGLVVVVD